MNTTRIRRTVRMSVVSLLFVLMAVSSLTIGSASAQSTSQSHLSQTSSLSPNLKSCRSNTVHIVLAKLGPFTGAFSCHAMTVKIGVPVRIVNPTDVGRFVENFTLGSFVDVFPHSTATMLIAQTGLFHLLIYDDLSHPRAQLFVTVVS